MATHGTREDLRHRVIEAFAVQDEIYRICTFGREAEGKHDRYSDIDVVVYSSAPIRYVREGSCLDLTEGDLHLLESVVEVFPQVQPVLF
jgi:predicted nucleotidyltransferase